MLAGKCCWKFLKRLSLVASACVVASAALPAQAIDNPYAYVVGASAMNMCLVRFGQLARQVSDDHGITEVKGGVAHLIQDQDVNIAVRRLAHGNVRSSY